MTVATDLASAGSVINQLIFRCSLAASVQRLGLSQNVRVEQRRVSSVGMSGKSVYYAQIIS